MPDFATAAQSGFGKQLKAERERRSISLDHLCAETKINLRHFEALEAGNFAALPGGVFRRSIVRAYAASVGLEEDLWLSRFDASYADLIRANGGDSQQAERAWQVFAENVRKNRRRRAESTRLRWLGVVVLFVLLAAAGWAVWLNVLHPHLKQSPF